MIGFTSERIKEEWDKAPAALRLVVEALDSAHGGATFVFRVLGHTRFESGTHSMFLSCDVELRGASEQAINAACVELNKKFPLRGTWRGVATLMADPANLPGGRRIDTPHVHVQIPLDWKVEPRAFLRDYGFLQNTHKLD